VLPERILPPRAASEHGGLLDGRGTVTLAYFSSFNIILHTNYNATYTEPLSYPRNGVWTCYQIHDMIFASFQAWHLDPSSYGASRLCWTGVRWLPEAGKGRDVEPRQARHLPSRRIGGFTDRSQRLSGSLRIVVRFYMDGEHISAPLVGDYIGISEGILRQEIYR